jgi:hypothetical protein
MRPLIAFAATAAFAFCAGPMSTVADARTYQVHFHNQATLKSLCKKGGGKFNSGHASYSCTYKNGNIRECNRETKKCVTETPPKRTWAGGKPGVAIIPPVGGSILDPGSGLGTQGPAATGAPLSTGRGSAPPPGRIN